MLRSSVIDAVQCSSWGDQRAPPPCIVAFRMNGLFRNKRNQSWYNIHLTVFWHFVNTQHWTHKPTLAPPTFTSIMYMLKSSIMHYISRVSLIMNVKQKDESSWVNVFSVHVREESWEKSNIPLHFVQRNRLLLLIIINRSGHTGLPGGGDLEWNCQLVLSAAKLARRRF